MTAVTDCLDWLGVKRLAVASPFRDQQNDHILRYFTTAGYEVTAIGGYPTHGLAQVRQLPDDAPYAKGMEVFRADPTAEVLFVTCPLWPVGRHTAALEQATGVPVLSVANTMIWAALHAMGHPGGVRDFGRILEDPQRAPAQ